MSRSRLSCSDLLVSAELAESSASSSAAQASNDAADVEAESGNKYDKGGKQSLLSSISAALPSCFPSSGRSFQRMWTMMSYFAALVSLGVVLILVYATYSVE